MNTDLIHQLFEEYTLKYANLVKESGRLPRSVSGVSEDGKQFSLIVGGLDFDHIERHNFIKSVLESEQSIAYAYGSLLMSGTDKKDEFEETLAIIAANSQQYVWGEWRVFRNSDGDAIGLQHASTHESDDPDDMPGAWFLTDALKFSKKDRAKFEVIWKNLRKDAQFRYRNDFGSNQTSDKVFKEEATQEGTDHLLRAPEIEQLGRVTTVVQPIEVKNKCFQFNMAKIEAEKADNINSNAELFIKAENEAETVIDAFFSDWKVTTQQFLNNLSITCRQQKVWPWAIALYEKEFKLAGHVVSIRQQKEDFSFGSYSLELGQFSMDDDVPPFSFLLVNKKVALADAAKKSLLFEQAWTLLKDKDESWHWICLPSSPSEEWVKKTSEGDDKLFMTEIRRQPPIFPVSTVKSPRMVLVEHSESRGGELPIRGGWGYTKEDACIIDKNDPIVDPSLPFDGIGVEKTFVEKRIYEEMIILLPSREKFSGIKWNLQVQYLVPDDGRYYDKLVYEITAFRDNDWEELKAEFEGPDGYRAPNFDHEAHEKKRQERMVRFTRDFWFDITSFYGQGVIITDNSTGKKELLPLESFKFADKFKKFFGID